MNERQWLDLLRQYASKARRNHTSYAEVVDHITQAFLTQSLEGVDEPADRRTEMNRVASVVNREYAVWDKDFTEYVID